MAEKYLNTRILLKYDTFENWNKSSGILKKGEVAVCTVALAPTKDVNSVTAPQVLFKVGDGEHTFANLPWASGLAADVYGWAKAEDKPTYAASEITGLQKFVEELDTNTTYQIIAGSKAGLFKLQKQEKGKWIDVTSSTGVVEFGIDEKAITDRLTSLETVVQWDKTNLALGTDNVGQILLADGSSRPVYIPANGLQDSEEDLAFLSDIPSGSGSVTPTDNVTVVDSVSLSGHTLSGSTKKFVGARGVSITGTESQITVTGPDLSGYATKSELPKIPGITVTPDIATGNYPKADEVVVLSDISASGHTITQTGVKVPTKQYVDKIVQGSVQYIGGATVSSVAATTSKTLTELLTKKQSSISNGDFIRVLNDGVMQQWSSDGTKKIDCKIHKGDVLYIANLGIDIDNVQYLLDNPCLCADTTSLVADRTGFQLSHGEDVGVTSITVTGTDGLTGTGTVTSEGTITLNHGVPAGASEGTKGSNAARTYLKTVTTDKFGHVTGFTTGKETVTDTHYEGKNVVGASATTQANGAATANPYLNFVENGTVRSHHQIKGAGATKVTADASGNITITSTNTDTHRAISVDDTNFLDNSITSGSVNFKAGNNVTLSTSKSGGLGNITINATNTSHNHAAGTGLEMSGTAGTSSGTVTYTVKDYNNILSSKNAATTPEAAKSLVNEGGDTIFFCCGDSNF